MKIINILTIVIILFLSANIASAMTITSVQTDTFSPGQEGTIVIEIENTLQDDADDVVLRLDLENLPFSPIGSSEYGVDEIDENDEERFIFRLKAANDINPGDYKIPYTLSFFVRDEQRQRSGSIGVTLKANSELFYSLSTSNPIISQQGESTLKIINKGFGDAKFVLVRLLPDNSYTLLSDQEVYIGTVDSDDFESATFDVIYKSSTPIFKAIIEYKDFDNKKITETINLPVTIYTKERAIELGISKKNNTPTYIIVIIAVILIWMLYRTIKKSRRLTRSRRQGG